jgi:hypothetical protein
MACRYFSWEVVLHLNFFPVSNCQMFAFHVDYEVTVFLTRTHTHTKHETSCRINIVKERKR